jgi:hypothetical protein
MKNDTFYKQVVGKIVALNQDDSLSYVVIALVLGAIATFLVLQQPKMSNLVKSKVDPQDEREKITPVKSDFDWKSTTPRPYRPFKKGPHFMTMGIQTCSPNDWLLLENTYETITNLRGDIIDNNKEHTVLYHPMAQEAVEEVYELCLGYMMDKYPQYFYVDQDPAYLVNGIKDVKVAVKAKSIGSCDEIIRTLARNIEEDFLILMLDEDTQQYYLRAGSFAFPSGFDPAIKLNLALKDIHGPVPLYKEKIEKSMDRFFAKMKVGQWVQRYNWSIQTHSQLYAPSLNHAPEGVRLEPLDPKMLNFSKVYMRCERQILTRLPRTKHLLFTIRTYLTPLSELRKEERCLELAEAIDSLPDNMAHYKKREEWGPAVTAYLRKEVEGVV